MSTLFAPIKLGAYDLAHRVVLAPGDISSSVVATFYGQRASEGGLDVVDA